MKPLRPPAAPSDRSSALQPQVDGSDLAPFQQTRVAENAARLEGDKELLHTLMLAAYAGPEWKRFTFVLAEYGMGVMTSWIRNGIIFAQCKKRKLGLGAIMSRSPEDVHDLATDTVTASIIVFREKVLIPRVWYPNKGAGLMTFFIGQCVFQFPNVYRKWRTENAIRLSVPREVIAQELEHARCQPASTETLVELSRHAARLAPGNSNTAEAMIAMGYSISEVANEFGMRERALDSQLYRHRRSRS